MTLKVGFDISLSTGMKLSTDGRITVIDVMDSNLQRQVVTAVIDHVDKSYTPCKTKNPDLFHVKVFKTSPCSHPLMGGTGTAVACRRLSVYVFVIYRDTCSGGLGSLGCLTLCPFFVLTLTVRKVSYDLMTNQMADSINWIIA